MSRQLRLMNDAVSIKGWISAMQSIYLLLDNFTKNNRILNLSSLVEKKLSPRPMTKSELTKVGKTVEPKISINKNHVQSQKIAITVYDIGGGSSTAELTEKKLAEVDMELNKRPLLKQQMVNAKRRVIRGKRTKVKEPLRVLCNKVTSTARSDTQEDEILEKQSLR